MDGLICLYEEVWHLWQRRTVFTNKALWRLPFPSEFQRRLCGFCSIEFKFRFQDGSCPYQDREEGLQGHHWEILHQAYLGLRHQQAHHRGSGSDSHQVAEEQDCRIHHSLGKASIRSKESKYDIARNRSSGAIMIWACFKLCTDSFEIMASNEVPIISSTLLAIF